MKKILIILPRGETLRNFVYTEIIERLREKYHITIASVKPNDKLWQMLKKIPMN